MDDTTAGILKAANVSKEMLLSLSREDIRDLFPGPEHFLRRRAIWKMGQGANEEQESTLCVQSTSYDLSPTTNSPIDVRCTPPRTSDQHATPPDRPSDQHATPPDRPSDQHATPPDRPSDQHATPPRRPSDQHATPPRRPSDQYATPPCRPSNQYAVSRAVQLTGPEYVLYSDSELEQSRIAFFEKQRIGQEGDYTLSKELRCRLIRNTITSMVSIKRATGDGFQCPCHREITLMAKRLVEYYPMLRDRSQTGKDDWDYIRKQLQKRLHNVTTPKKKQGPTPSRKRPRSLCNETGQGPATDDTDESSSSTVILELSPQSKSSTPESGQLDAPETTESQKTQARHYKTLQEMYKAKAKPNKTDVSQLLDLEFQSRRAFIDSDAVKEQRAVKILDAYPCFKEVDHVMDELRRIIQPGNPKYIDEIKARWSSFYTSVRFYGVFKKVMRPPNTLDMAEDATAVFMALPVLFPSAVAPSKKLGNASEALLHILKPAEDPTEYVSKRPLNSGPILLVDQENYMIIIGTTPVTSFPKVELYEGLVYLMAYYYAFHLTYPKCIATLLSVLQTEVLGDALHERDATSSYKKAMSEWKKFIE